MNKDDLIKEMRDELVRYAGTLQSLECATCRSELGSKEIRNLIDRVNKEWGLE